MNENTQKFDYSRQLDIVSPGALARLHVTLIGVGGIGSATARQLGKCGITQIRLYDPQCVEDVNLPSQTFFADATGKPKVEACKHVLEAFSRITPECIQRTVNESESLGRSDVVVCGVDTIEARRSIWETHVKYNPQLRLYIDGRMGGLAGTIFSVVPIDPDHVVFYEETLHSPEASLEEPCTAQAINFNCEFIAALITRQIVWLAAGKPLERQTYFDLRGQPQLFTDADFAQGLP